MSNKSDWKELFRHKGIAPIVIGMIIGSVGLFTPFGYELGYISLGMVLIGFYFMVRDI